MKKIIVPLLMTSISLYGTAATVEIQPVTATDEAPKAELPSNIPANDILSKEPSIETVQAASETPLNPAADPAQPVETLEANALVHDTSPESAAEVTQRNEPSPSLVETSAGTAASSVETSQETAVEITNPAQTAAVPAEPSSAPVATPAQVTKAAENTDQSDQTTGQSQQIPSMVGKASNQSSQAARNRTWQNIAIAAGAVAIAVTALILVHNNNGHR